MADTLYQTERTKTFDIPLTHFDFKYIKECSDIKELEKIMKTLRTGEVGRYAELERCCEERIRNLDPDNRVLRVTVPLGCLRQLDEEERKEIEIGLEDWLSELKEETEDTEEAIKNRIHNRASISGQDLEEMRLYYDEQDLPPIRKEMFFKGDGQSATRAKGDGDGMYPRRFVKPRDYKEWDKLEKEWDKELAEESNTTGTDASEDNRSLEKGEKMSVSDAELRGLNKMSVQDLSKRVRTLPEQTRRQLAVKEKEKGNEAFHAGDYEEALVYYKRSLITFPTNAVYNNRALVYINQKKWSEAAKDCARVLKSEPDNQKALFRSGRANYELHNLDRAERDLEHLTDMDPLNKQAQKLLRLVRSEKSKRLSTRHAGGRRVEITEVGDSSDSSEDDGDIDSQKPSSTVPNFSNKNTENVSATKVAADSSGNGANKSYRVRRRSEYPPSNPGRQGMVIEELSDSETSVEQSIPELETFSQDNTLKKKESQENTYKTNGRSSSPVTHLVNKESVTDQFVKHREEGKRLLEQGDLENAFNCYTQCINLSSDNKQQQAASYRNRAVVALRMNQNQQALEDCSNSLDLEPNNEVALYRRGIARRSLGDYHGSVSDLKAALQLRPNSENIALELRKTEELLKTEKIGKTSVSPEIATEFELIGQQHTSLEDHESTDETFVTVNKEVLEGNKSPEWEFVPTPDKKTSTADGIAVYLAQSYTGPTVTACIFAMRYMSLRNMKKPERWIDMIKLLHDTGVSRLNEVIGIKLEANILDDIIQSLQWLCNSAVIAPDTALNFAKNVMLNLTLITRFDCTIFLVEDETVRAANILLEKFSCDDETVKQEELRKLKKKYATVY